MNFDFVTQWFLTVFPQGGEVVRLVGSIGHACTGVLLIYLCLVMFSLLIRGLIPNQMVRHLNLLDKDAKTAFSLMQAISAVGFSVQIGYLQMQEPWLSFGMFTGFTFILVTNLVFLVGVRFILSERLRGVLLQNKMADSAIIGLLQLSWSVLMLGSMASRY